MTWGAITDEGLAAAAELIGQPLRRSRMQWIETATRDAIRHFAWGIGDNNPLWLEPDYAASSPAGCLLAPPCILYAVDSTIVAPKLPGVQWIYAGTRWRWYDHIRVDDTFNVEAKLISQEVKSGRRFSKWVLQSGELMYRRDDGAPIATAIGRCARTPRVSHHQKNDTQPDEAARAAKPPAESQVHRYSQDELTDIEAQVLGETRRGAEPLLWDDVEVGQAIPGVVKGPLSVIDIVAWYAATQGALHYGGAHGDALRYRRRHADYHVNPKTGAKDAAGRGHLEASTGHDVGMGGAYDVGPQRIAWAQHMLCNWIGDHGFLHELDVAVLKPNLVGDTLWWRGTVEAKHISGALGLVQLRIEARNQVERLSATGTATVALPTRAHGAVPLPLPVVDSHEG